jgi:hypothetical protein
MPSFVAVAANCADHEQLSDWGRKITKSAAEPLWVERRLRFCSGHCLPETAVAEENGRLCGGEGCAQAVISPW